MNSNFSDEQISAYAAAFEDGDAIWCDGKWREVSKLIKTSRALSCESPNRYLIRCFDGKLAISGFKEEENPYRVTTLGHYELQGGEKLVWLGESCTARTFGKAYKTFVNEVGRVVYRFDDDSTAFRVAYNEWGIIPRYEQIKRSVDPNKKEPKFKVGDIVNFKGYDIPLTIRSVNATKEVPEALNVKMNEQSTEVNFDEVAIHSEIITRLVKQTIKGVKKYGDPVQHNNLSAVEWIDHAIDESIDQIVYLTALKQSLMSKGDEK